MTPDPVNPIDSIDQIDFALLYREHLARADRTRKDASAWDSRAAGMASKALRSRYASEFVARMDLDGATSLLDVGCGPGTIGLAVAERLQRVVGLDYSAAMSHSSARARRCAGRCCRGTRRRNDFSNGVL